MRTVAGLGLLVSLLAGCSSGGGESGTSVGRAISGDRLVFDLAVRDASAQIAREQEDR